MLTNEDFKFEIVKCFLYTSYLYGFILDFVLTKFRGRHCFAQEVWLGVLISGIYPLSPKLRISRIRTVPPWLTPTFDSMEQKRSPSSLWRRS